MLVMIRDRMRDLKKKGMTLEQVKAAQPDARFRRTLRIDDRTVDDGHVHRGCVSRRS